MNTHTCIDCGIEFNYVETDSEREMHFMRLGYAARRSRGRCSDCILGIPDILRTTKTNPKEPDSAA